MAETLLEHALQYARRGWRVFLLSPNSKIPRKGSHGHKDATTDAATIESWWGAVPLGNIGLATGDLVVVDADGPGALAELKALGGLPRTLTARTRRGYHFYFTAPPGAGLRSYNSPRAAKGGDGIDIKAAGGFVLLPPSRVKGHAYQWVVEAPPAELPAWVPMWLERQRGPNREPRRENGGVPDSDLSVLGKPPPWISCAPRLAPRAYDQMLLYERPRFLEALKCLPAHCNYETWFARGAAIHDFDPSSNGLEIFKAWSRSSETHNTERDQGACEAKWAEYGKPKVQTGKPLITRASIYAEANKVETQKAVEQVNGTHSLETALLPAEFVKATQQIRFVDLTKEGNPRATCANTRIAIEALEIECRRDVFHDRMEVGGHVIEQWQGEVSDNAIQMVRYAVYDRFGFDPGVVNSHDAAVQLALLHSYDPIVAYLDSLAWDGRTRLQTWLADYLGAERTNLNAEIGRLALVAAVRRVRSPGAKFDQITVLEGPEGTRKSTAIEILAGEDNFSDQTILALDDRAQQEAVKGIWLYEIADLAGISKAEVERVKAFASRKVDRARPAYGRARVDRPRRCVFFATTNSDTYLKSQTGNRRFWPVRTSKIKIEELTRDRDQIWAEAAAAERGASLFLPESLWGQVGELQETRRDVDPWDDILRNVRGVPAHDGTEYRVGSRDLFETHLRLGAERLNDAAAKRLCYSMRRLGWDGPKPMRIGDNIVKGYSRQL